MKTTSETEQDWISSLRANALRRFNSLEIPKLKYGLTIKIDLDNFDFENFPEPEASKQEIISPKGIIILDFNEAVKEYPDLIKNKFMNELAPPLSKFEAFHASNWKKATVIVIPKGKEFKEPIQINTLFENSNIENFLIIAEQNSSATIIDSIANSGSSDKKINSRISEIFLESGAKINFFSVQDCDKNTFTFTVKRALAEQDSEINWLDCSFGGDICTSETTTILNGAGSSTNNYGLFFGTGAQKFDINSKSIHIAPNTSSDMLTKGVLEDSAKAVYRGILNIHPTAFDASGYQKEEVILLSEKAEADSIPELRINNNDVKKCTHGASIGQIDAEKLFYLMSRGLERREAVKSMIEAFFSSVREKIKNKEFSERIQKIVEDKLEAK